MKTAISLPDRTFEKAEKVAKRLGTTRSKLYTEAIELYLNRIDDSQVTRQLNEIYKSEKSSLDPGLRSLQFKSLPKDQW